MAKEKKPRTQYNWKFKDNESEQFYEWFNNQDNISSSLRNMVYHIIELYGTNDILEPNIQKQFVKDSLILESLKGQNVLNVNPQMVFADNKENQHQKVAPKQEETVQNKNEIDEENTIEQNDNSEQDLSKNDTQSASDIYSGDDPNSL